MKNTIKNFLRNFLTTIMSPNWIWNLYKPIAELNADIYLKKKQKEKAENDIKFFEALYIPPCSLNYWDAMKQSYTRFSTRCFIKNITLFWT